MIITTEQLMNIDLAYNKSLSLKNKLLNKKDSKHKNSKDESLETSWGYKNFSGKLVLLKTA